MECVVDKMPYEPSMPCAACATGVDPLRAPAVLASERGYRYFCSAECRESYRRADGSRRLAASPLAEANLGARGEELARVVLREVPSSVPAGAVRAPSPWPLFVCGPAVALGFMPGPLPLLAASALLGLLTIWITVSARLPREDAGPVAWLAPPCGVFLLIVSAWVSTQRLSMLAAAALGVFAIWAREYLALRAQAPVDRLLSDLRARVPTRARLAVQEPGQRELTDPGAATALLCAGDEVVVAEGEVVPVDGVVSLGEARVLPYPGAREPVVRRVSDALLAGARVVEGTLQVTATRVGDARALFRPVSFGLEDAPGAAQVTRLAARTRALLSGLLYVLFVSGLGLLFVRDARTALAGVGAALLAFPALSLVRGLKLPFVSASALAASRGMVFRDAVTMERAGRVTATALCTDGTVTLGSCTLIEVNPLSRDQDVGELTALAMGAEQAAEPHPIAEAVRRFGEERGIAPILLRRAAYTRGRGVTALVDGGGPLVLGNRQLLLASGVSVAVADREAQRAESEGHTVLFLSVGGRVRGLLIFEDPVRPEARAAVQRLFDLDVEVVLLSGDHRTSVEALARTLDITHVKAELSSEERAAEVGRLREAGGVVATIGRAPADELALSTADIALTLDAAGSSLEGDVAVASGDLRDAAEALLIARSARKAAQRTLASALGVGVSLGALGALGALHPVLIVALALSFDAWSLPTAARLLRPTSTRPRVAGRGPLSGLFRRA